jgi:hypothetical protein
MRGGPGQRQLEALAAPQLPCDGDSDEEHVCNTGTSTAGVAVLQYFRTTSSHG